MILMGNSSLNTTYYSRTTKNSAIALLSELWLWENGIFFGGGEANPFSHTLQMNTI